MKKIELPRISERIRGFTVSANDVVHVFDYDEVFRVNLHQSTVEVLTLNPYVFEEEHPHFLGVSENPPCLRVGTASVSYNFNPSANAQAVQVTLDGQRHEISFRTLSGDWFVATLSPEGRYLVIAEPYLIEVYKLGAIASASGKLN